MVNFRKLAKFALTGSLAFGLIAAAGSMNAQAADGAKPKEVKVDFEAQTLSVTPDDGKKANCFYVVVEIDSKVKSTDKIEYNMNNGEADTSKPKVIDISGLNYSKDVTFKVYQEDALSDGEVKDTEIQTVVVKAQPKKVTAKFNPKDGTIKVTGSKDLAAEGWEYRTTYNNTWTSGDEFNVEDYTTYGATLIVREAAVVDSTTPANNRLASKEVKVKIPKKANGPKATIDPIKITVKIPAKAEWRIVGSKRADNDKGTRADVWSATKGTNDDGWIAADSKAITLSASDINKKIDSKATTSAQSTAGKLDILKEGVTIEVKMAGTDKKLESKIGSITIPAQGSAPTKETASDKNDFTWEPVINTKTNKVTGLKFHNNNSSQSLQIYVEESSKVDTSGSTPAIAADYDPTSVKFTTVGPGKDKVIPVATAKEGNYLFVRFIGVKENAKNKVATSLSSALAFDKIEYPADITKSLNVTLAKGSNTGETAVTAPAATTSGNKMYYKVEDKEPKFIPLKSTKTSLGLSNELTAGSSKTVSGLTAGKYLIAYECDSKDNVIKYGVTKIEESHIKEAPTT